MNIVYRQISIKFMLSTLGPRAKYSCCLYPIGKESLAQAENYMLESYCEKAKLVDGQDALDLGCGTMCCTMCSIHPTPVSEFNATRKDGGVCPVPRRGMWYIYIYMSSVGSDLILFFFKKLEISQLQDHRAFKFDNSENVHRRYVQGTGFLESRGSFLCIRWFHSRLSPSITVDVYTHEFNRGEQFKIPNYFSYPSFSFDRILSIGVGYTFNHELTNQRGSEDVRTCEELQSTLLQDLYLASPSEREKWWPCPPIRGDILLQIYALPFRWGWWMDGIEFFCGRLCSIGGLIWLMTYDKPRWNDAFQGPSRKWHRGVYPWDWVFNAHRRTSKMTWF